MPSKLTKRRLILGAGVFVLAGLLLLLIARLWLTGMAVNSLLRLAGAAEIRLNIAAASPWRVVVEDVDFRVRTQGFAAKRVTFTRAHWWVPSLGAVRVEQARVAVTIDGSDTNPTRWGTYQDSRAAFQPWQTPLDELVVEGHLVVQAAALPPQELAVTIEARQSGDRIWSGHGRAAGPGLSLMTEASYDIARDVLDFQVPEASLDVAIWQDFVQRLVLLPGGKWETGGRLTARAEGRLAGRQLAMSGTVQLREGRAAVRNPAVSAAGIEADLTFTDLARFVSQPGPLRIRELQAGRLVLADLEAELAFAGPDQLAVTRAALHTLGGRVAAEPFNYFLNQRELEAVVLVDGIGVDAIIALTPDLPAKAVGRVNGRFPIRIDGTGLRLGTGWLELMPGVHAEIQFNGSPSGKGLLTRGVPASHPGHDMLLKVEAGLLRLKITELRLDIRPPNAPPGRSAQLHLVGEPVDPGVKAPVTLDLNVNGPLEQLLQLGFDSRLSLGTQR